MLAAGSPLSAWLTWLETLSPAEIDLGLDRVQEVLGRLDIKRPGHVLLIAGTNGKGSSVAMADALLRAASFRVGAYTSPHISVYNERIVIDGRRAGDEEIIAAFEQIEAVRDGVPLTYFEYGTLAALVVFADAEVDVWILEVGMGGRLDATNAITPTAALITNVSLDHCDWLGDDIETIAAEKAGIMRPGLPVVYGGARVPATIAGCAEETGAKLLLRDRDYRLDGVPQPGLGGACQRGNAAAILALLDAAGLAAATDPALVAAVLPTIRLTGRCQRVECDGVDYLLDVAHNPAAAKALAVALQEEVFGGETTALIGMLDDKDVEGVVGHLDGVVARWVAVTANSRRAIPASELARRIANACKRPCLVAGSTREGMQIARQSLLNNDRILVTGSFYLVGPVLDRLRPQS